MAQKMMRAKPTASNHMIAQKNVPGNVEQGVEGMGGVKPSKKSLWWLWILMAVIVIAGLLWWLL